MKHFRFLVLLLVLLLVGCTKLNIDDFKDEIIIEYVENDNQNSVHNDLTLPTVIKGTEITWTSDSEFVVIEDGKAVVNRQDIDITATLSASITVDGEIQTVDFEVVVLKDEVDTPDYDLILNQITVPAHTSVNLVLPTRIDEVELTWFSNHSSITDTGIVTRQAEDVTVTLTVKVVEDMTFFKTFVVVVDKKTEYPISKHMPIAEVREKAQNAAVKVQGVVTSLMSNGNYSIQDSSGAIPVYFGANKNNELVIGTEYVIEGVLGSFEGLIQIINPKIIQTLGTRTLPEGIDLTGYSLEFEDITLFEANIVTYFGLEVVSKASPNNALELTLKNDANETTMVRLDQRVNDTPYPFTDIKVGEIVDLFNVTLGQYAGQAQLLFTRRSSIDARPKNPETISIYGVNNKNFIVGEIEPNLLEGITAKNGFNTDFTHLLDVDDSLVNFNVAGKYKVTVYLTTDSSVFATYTLYVRKPVEPGVYEGYYEKLDGLTGIELNNELRDLIRNTGTSTGSTAQVKSVDRVGTSYYLIYDGMGSYGNREHVWPNSKLGSVKYDLHNLRAAKTSTNSARSNYPFADNNKPFTGSQPYEKIGSTWYPGDKHIGDVARIVFYISIRENLSLNLVGNVDLFLEWHELDPVDDFEINRNDNIFEIQNNRNPFIDHPELAQIYFGNGTMSTTLALLDLTFDMFSYNRNYAI